VGLLVPKQLAITVEQIGVGQVGFRLAFVGEGAEVLLTVPATLPADTLLSILGVFTTHLRRSLPKPGSGKSVEDAGLHPEAL